MRALLVEDGHSRGALAAARALTKAGWEVGVAAPEPQGVAWWSRAVKWRHRITVVTESAERFIDDIERAVSKASYDVVFPCGDAEVFALSAGRERVGGVVPYAPHDAVMRAFDKLELTRTAAKCGLSTPWTSEATDEALAGAPMPVIVKARLHSGPVRSRVDEDHEAGQGRHRPAADHGQTPARRLEVGLARDTDEARRLIASVSTAGGEPLLQEVVAGDLCALTLLLARDGTVLGEVQQVADGTWPPGAGASVRAVTEPVSEALRERAVELLTTLGWFGLAEIQFIRPRSGEPRLIDLNGRFYGSLALALKAGVNLPAAWAETSATGSSRRDALPAISSARAGVRYQWLEGDLRRAFQGPKRVTQVWSCIRYSFGATHSIWSPRDPWPGLRQAARVVGSAVRKGATRKGRS